MTTARICLAGLLWAGLTTAVASAQRLVSAPLEPGFDAVLANPATVLPDAYTLRLAGVAQAASTNFALEDYGERVDGRLLVSARRVAERIDDDPRGSLSVAIGTIGYHRAGPTWHWGLSHALRLEGAAAASRDLTRVLLIGNEPLAGERLSLGVAGRQLLFQELGIHAARTVSPGLRLGGRVKVLGGAAAVAFAEESGTGASAFGELVTDPEDYSVELDAQLAFRTAGLDLDLATEEYGLDVARWNPAAGLGVGVDLGAVWTPGPQFELGLALRDVGVLRYTDRARRHSVDARVRYDGLTGNVFVDDLKFDGAAVYDSLLAAAGLTTGAEAFTVGLSPRLHAHARYRVGPAATLGVAALYELGDAFGPDLVAAVHHRLGSTFVAGVSAGVLAGNPAYGASLTARFGVLGITASTEQLAALYAADRVRTLRARVGVQLQFGDRAPGEYRPWFRLGEPSAGPANTL